MTDPKKARCYTKDWRYVRSEATDVAKTFARIRREQKEAEVAKKPATVRALVRKGEAA